MAQQQRSKEDMEYVGVKVDAARLDEDGAQTDKALGLKLGSDKRLTWIPKSMVKDFVREDTVIMFAVQRWIFVDKQMDDYQDADYVDLDAI